MTLLESRFDPTTPAWQAMPQFVLPDSAVRFEFHTPFARPELWLRYLDGALTTYRAFGVEQALAFDEVRSGLSTTLFVVGISPSDEVVAGARFAGPIREPSDAHVTEEFAGSNGERRVREELTRRIPEGVIEFKGCWAEIGHPQGRELSAALARSVVHAMRWLNVQYCCCSAATHAAPRWAGSGGLAMPGLEPIPYPSDQYRTTLLWWDMHRIWRDADPGQWTLLQEEQTRMANTVGLPADGIRVLS